MDYSTIKTCRVCGKSRFDSIIHLGQQALTGVFPRSVTEPIVAGPVELVKCDERNGGCGLVQLRQSYDPDAMYGANYGYRSGLNASMARHLEGKVRSAMGIADPQAGDLILDIGSNDATTLRAYPERKFELAGFDPAGSKFASFYPTHVTLIPDYFNAAAFRKTFPARKAKIITSFAMFYDLEAPQAFMADIHQFLAEDGIWMFEQSYLPSMIKANAYDTICHEHLNYYALRQIKWMTDRAGLKILDVELSDVNGGSFCVVAARQTSSYAENTDRVQEVLAFEEASGLSDPPLYESFRQKVFGHRDELRKFVKTAAAADKSVYGYGASTKGNVLLQFCNFSANDIQAIAEINDDKFGAYTPGTLIPIRSEAEVRSCNPEYMLVLPWHFRDGIVQREAAYLKQGGKLVFPLPQLEVVAHSGILRGAA